MKKGLLITIGCIVAVLVVIGITCVSSYNGLVDLNEEIDGKFSDISVQLERRNDLIPNLVSTVKGYAKHEKDVIESVTTAREKMAGAKTFDEKLEADQELSSALSRLLVVVENYPTLTANQNFINLQDELAGTENRIAVARKEYNNAVKDYNSSIKKFPKSIIASMFNFEERQYFEAKESANEVPNVSFE